MQILTMTWRSICRFTTTIAFLMLLVACGGGGGDGDSSSGNNTTTNFLGSLDLTFGSNGVVTFNNPTPIWPAGRDDSGQAIILDGNGRILITGTTINYGGYQSMALWRYHTNGTPDITFGTNSGFSFYNGAAGGGSSDVGNAIAIDSLGRILVAGHGRDSTEKNDDMVLWRYNSNGSLDTTFGNSGIVVHRDTAGMVATDEARGVAVDSNGRIVVVGYCYGTVSKADAVVWRFTATGALDNTFGGDYDSNGTPDGFVLLNGAAYPDSFDFANAVKLDPGGRIVVTGASGNAVDNNDMVVWRLTSSGSLDTSFGGDYDSNGTPDGFVKHDGAMGASSYDGATAITLDITGRIIVVGSSSASGTGNYKMVIWQITQDGILDTTFGGDYDNNGIGDGFTRYNSGGTSVGRGVVLDANNLIVVAGYSNDGTSYDDVAVWRYNSDGVPDTTFGNSGIATYDTPPLADLDSDQGSGIALDSSGRILVTGSSMMGNLGYRDMVLFRFNP